MLKVYFSLSVVLFYIHTVRCIQPYFPSQITFSPDNSQTIIAIDELNQRAYHSLTYGSTGQETSYAMEHFPYAIPDSPQSKYYVQLLTDSAPLGCMYGTYWKYGGNTFNIFPAHWLNGTSFTIGNYMKYKYEMIHSAKNSQDEDYWYANETCQVDSGESYPCQEIFFKRNTEIPLRLTQVVRRGWNVVQEIIQYRIIAMGKPDEKLFDSIPKNWSLICRDVTLGLLFYPQSTKLNQSQSVNIQIWLPTPPHRIDNNDTVTIQWKSTQCNDCFTWTPKQLSFNSETFQKQQTLTITRVKNGPKTTLIPVFNGGGFNVVPPEIYPIYIE